MRWFFGLALLLLLVPSGAALTPGEHVIEYMAWIHTGPSADGIYTPFNVQVPSLHDWDSVGGRTTMEVRASYTIDPGSTNNQVAVFRVYWNGVQVIGCQWTVESASAAALASMAYVSVFCPFFVVVTPGQHVFEVRREFVLGAPVSHADISVVLHQTETVSMDIQIGTTFDATIILSLVLGIAFLGVIVWARAQDLMLQVLGSVLVYFATLIALSNRGTWDSMVALAIVLGLAASYLLVRAFLDRATTGPAGGLG